MVGYWYLHTDIITENVTLTEAAGSYGYTQTQGLVLL